MAPSPLQQRRTHNTLLFQKLLNLRDGASPFTLVLDTLEQGGWDVAGEFARRAKIAKSKIVFISFATLRKKVSIEIDIFISSRGKSLSTLLTEILSHLAPTQNNPSTAPQKTLLLIDTLNSICSSLSTASSLPAFLSSLLVSPTVSLVATYHTDIPIPISASHISSSYNPDPLTTLNYLATAILRTHSLSHTIARKRARDRSLQEPVFGLEENREGVIVGLQGSGKENGVVVEMEIRRKSGRGIVEAFVLYAPTNMVASNSVSAGVGQITLLEDNPVYSSTPSGIGASEGDRYKEGEEVETTFNLGLTEKQKRDREAVVLPYFDAQKDGGALGAGEGGRILYEMGVEDREDFDDEEDEI